MKKSFILISLFLIWFTFSSFTYPEKFTKMMVYILKFEGGLTYIDYPELTNFGIMQVNYDSYRIKKKLKPKSVEFITMDEVYDLYYKNYYLKSGSDTLPTALSFVNMDAAVNFGTGGSKKFLIKTFSENAQFIENINECDKELAYKYIELRKKERYAIVLRNKTKQKFLKGWLNRDEKVRVTVEKYY